MIRKEDYTNYYEKGKFLGQGGFGTIYKGIDKKSKKEKAIKIYAKNRVKEYLRSKVKKAIEERDLQSYYNTIRNEAKNMNILQGNNKENKNAVILDDCFETDEEFVFIMEKCDNNLYTYLALRGNAFNADEIYEILNQLNNSFKIMVKNKIFHRALKPQNILLKLNEEKTKYLFKLKMTDDSCSLNDSSTFLSSDNENNYKIYAPEVLKTGEYTDEKSDLWSLGILIYLLYFNDFPFKGISKENQITEDMINKLGEGKNMDLNNLIRELLIIQPKRRISWEEYFNHSFFRKKMDFRNFYKLNEKKELGISEYGIIYEGEDIKTGQIKAIKIMNKNRIKSILQDRHEGPPHVFTDEDLKPIIDRFFKEVNNMEILQGLNNENQNTVIFNEYFNTNEEFVIIMELCDNNLLQYITKEKQNNKLNFEEIHNILSQLNNSFEIMVKNKIVHRALKSENILMKYENKEKTKYLVKLKLTDDSGLLDSSSNSVEQKINNRNLEIYAPEVIDEKKYTEKSDLFSLGILIYFLYFKEYPFEGKTNNEILNNKKKGILKELSKNSDFDDLLKKLLNPNEKERISWKDYFKHQFFRVNQNYSNYYEIIKDKDKEVQLGTGGYGIIYKAKDKKTGKEKAIKIMNKDRIKNDLMDQFDEIREPTDEDLKPIIDGFFKEVNNMKILEGINNQNQNTVIFDEYFNNNENFAIVMELCNDNLYNYIKKKSEYLKLEEIQQILIQLNNSFRIMVKNKILHRALKAQNILIKKEGNSKILFKLKLTDNSCLLKESSNIDIKNIKFNRNLSVYAPEVLNGGIYTEESDLWSLGILIYFLKFKTLPFAGKNEDEIKISIKRGLIEKLSENSYFNDLVNKLLVEDPKERMSWKEYFKHPFLNKKISD